MTESEKFQALHSIYSSIDNYRIALYILNNSTVTAQQVADAFNKDRPNISRILNRMVKANVLESYKGFNPVVFKLTPLGFKILAFIK